jgi:hypothetical protein
MTDQNRPEGAAPDGPSSTEPAADAAMPQDLEPDEVLADVSESAGASVPEPEDLTPATGAVRPETGAAAPAGVAAASTSQVPAKSAKGRPAAAVAPASTTEGPDQPHYVDDPVSKWWVAIIVAVFALIFAWAILFGGNGLLGGGDDESVASPAPSLVASPAPSASPAASASPTASASAGPTAAATTEPTAPATPEPTAAATPAPTPEPTVAATPEPTMAPTPVPTAAATQAPSPAASETVFGPAASPAG